MFANLQNKHPAEFNTKRYLKFKKLNALKLSISLLAFLIYILKYYMKKFLKVGLIVFILSSLIAMPIKAAKYDKKKPSDLYTKAIEHLDKNQYGKAQKYYESILEKRKMMLTDGHF